MTRAPALLTVLVMLALAAPADVSAAPSSQRDRMTVLAARVFGGGYAGRVAVCIIDRETGHTFDPAAVSETNDVGLMQLHWPTWARPGESFAAFRSRLSHPLANLRAAFAIYHPKPGVFSFLPAWSADRSCL